MNNSITVKKIAEKWYFGLIIIPIVTTYLTEYIQLPDLFNNWNYTVITCLCILSLILIGEIIALTKKVNFSPSEKDKKTINKLLSTLDVDVFQKDIAEQDSWYGYSKEAIGKVIEFNEDVKLVSNRCVDEKLNTLIDAFSKSLREFQSFSSMNLYGQGPSFFTPAKDSEEEYEKAKNITCPKMNDLAHNAFIDLNEMLNYLNKKNYLA